MRIFVVVIAAIACLLFAYRESLAQGNADLDPAKYWECDAHVEGQGYFSAAFTGKLVSNVPEYFKNRRAYESQFKTYIAKMFHVDDGSVQEVGCGAWDTKEKTDQVIANRITDTGPRRAKAVVWSPGDPL